jgi:hypothetical protein
MQSRSLKKPAAIKIDKTNNEMGWTAAVREPQPKNCDRDRQKQGRRGRFDS